MLARLAIREKLAGVIAALLILLALTGGLAINRMQALHDATEELSGNWLPSINAVAALRTTLNQHRATVILHVIADTAQRRAALDQQLAGLATELTQGRAAYARLISEAEERRQYAIFVEALPAYERAVAAVIAASSAGAKDRAESLYEETVAAAFTQLVAPIVALTRINTEGGVRAASAADDAYAMGRNAVLGLLAFAVGLGLLLGFLIQRGIARDIHAIAAPMQRLAEGDLAIVVPALAARTEMGGFARRLQVFKDAMLAKRDADAATLADAEDKARRATVLQGLVSRFDTQAAQSLGAVTAAVQQLDGMSGSMTETARRTEQQASAVARSAEQASGAVQTVASAAEELGASIAEVARQITETASMARSAAEDARATDAAVTGLSEAAQRIGEVVKLISDIAGQTNLLALNATIEAARAGEHGKGFAVVASEVKQLAAQTTSATGQIANQIAAMQAETQQAVAAIRAIAQTVGKVDSITVQVAAAAEEQSSATQEIIRAVVGAATGTQEVTQITGDLTQGANATGAAAAQVRASSAELAQRSEALRREVDAFLAGVRAA